MSYGGPSLTNQNSRKLAGSRMQVEGKQLNQSITMNINIGENEPIVVNAVSFI